MSEEFQGKYVGYVATLIGVVVLGIGLIGVLLSLT